MYVEVRDPNTGKLLFRFDPDRDLIEIKSRQRTNLIDLSALREAHKPKEEIGQPH